MKSFVRCLLLTIIVLGSNWVCAQDQNILANEYDKAFYAENYEIALPIIDSLAKIDPMNLHYKREKVKMLALLDQQENFIQEVFELRDLEIDQDLPHIAEVLNFPGLPRELEEMIRIRAEKEQDELILNNFFPQRLENGTEMVKATALETVENQGVSSDSPSEEGKEAHKTGK